MPFIFYVHFFFFLFLDPRAITREGLNAGGTSFYAEIRTFKLASVQGTFEWSSSGLKRHSPLLIRAYDDYDGR